MPQYLYNSGNAILDEGVYLPKVLFHHEEPKSKSIPPVAAFNPDAALSGNGFEPSISPVKTVSKKTLIIDKNSFPAYYDDADKVVFVRRLKAAGFDIYIALKDSSNLHKIKEGEENQYIASGLEVCGKAHFNNLAIKDSISRNKTFLLSEREDDIRRIVSAFEQVQYTNGGNAFKDVFEFGPEVGTSDEKVIEDAKDDIVGKIKHEIDDFINGAVDLPRLTEFIKIHESEVLTMDLLRKFIENHDKIVAKKIHDEQIQKKDSEIMELIVEIWEGGKYGLTSPARKKNIRDKYPEFFVGKKQQLELLEIEQSTDDNIKDSMGGRIGRYIDEITPQSNQEQPLDDYNRRECSKSVLEMIYLAKSGNLRDLKLQYQKWNEDINFELTREERPVKSMVSYFFEELRAQREVLKDKLYIENDIFSQELRAQQEFFKGLKDRRSTREDIEDIEDGIRKNTEKQRALLQNFSEKADKTTQKALEQEYKKYLKDHYEKIKQEAQARKSYDKDFIFAKLAILCQLHSIAKNEDLQLFLEEELVAESLSYIKIIRAKHKQEEYLFSDNRSWIKDFRVYLDTVSSGAIELPVNVTRKLFEELKLKYHDAELKNALEGESQESLNRFEEYCITDLSSLVVLAPNLSDELRECYQDYVDLYRQRCKKTITKEHFTKAIKTPFNQNKITLKSEEYLKKKTESISEELFKGYNNLWRQNIDKFNEKKNSIKVKELQLQSHILVVPVHDNIENSSRSLLEVNLSQSFSESDIRRLQAKDFSSVRVVKLKSTRSNEEIIEIVKVLLEKISSESLGVERIILPKQLESYMVEESKKVRVRKFVSARRETSIKYSRYVGDKKVKEVQDLINQLRPRISFQFEQPKRLNEILDINPEESTRHDVSLEDIKEELDSCEFLLERMIGRTFENGKEVLRLYEEEKNQHLEQKMMGNEDDYSTKREKQEGLTPERQMMIQEDARSKAFAEEQNLQAELKRQISFKPRIQKGSDLLNKKKSGQIKISPSVAGSSRKMGYENSAPDSVITLCSLGETLNSSERIRVRTSVITRDILDKDNEIEQKYSPATFTTFTPLLIPEDDLKRFKQIDSSSAIYSKLNDQISANQFHRLPSPDSSDELQGILLYNLDGTILENSQEEFKQFEFKRGDDDMFYVSYRGDKSIRLSYIVKSPPLIQQKKGYQESSIDSVAKKIITEYLNPHEGFKPQADPRNSVPDKKSMSHHEWMSKIFRDRSGSCRHRVMAVEYMLATSNIDRESFRAVSIDNNHIILELKDENGKWHKVDLGGANMNIVETKVDYVAFDLKFERKQKDIQPRKVNSHSRQRLARDQEAKGLEQKMMGNEDDYSTKREKQEVLTPERQMMIQEDARSKAFAEEQNLQAELKRQISFDLKFERKQKDIRPRQVNSHSSQRLARDQEAKGLKKIVSTKVTEEVVEKPILELKRKKERPIRSRSSIDLSVLSEDVKQGILNIFDQAEKVSPTNYAVQHTEAQKVLLQYLSEIDKPELEETKQRLIEFINGSNIGLFSPQQSVPVDENVQNGTVFFRKTITSLIQSVRNIRIFSRNARTFPDQKYEIEKPKRSNFRGIKIGDVEEKIDIERGFEVLRALVLESLEKSNIQSIPASEADENAVNVSESKTSIEQESEKNESQAHEAEKKEQGVLDEQESERVWLETKNNLAKKEEEHKKQKAVKQVQLESQKVAEGIIDTERFVRGLGETVHKERKEEEHKKQKAVKQVQLESQKVAEGIIDTERFVRGLGETVHKERKEAKAQIAQEKKVVEAKINDARQELQKEQDGFGEKLYKDFSETVNPRQNVRVIKDRESLKTTIANEQFKKILVTTSDITANSNFILASNKDAGIETYYIDSPNKIDIGKDSLLIEGEDQVRLRKTGHLDDFLKMARENPEKEQILMINWSAFSSNQKVALNTLIDDNDPTIHGVEIPANVRIVGFSNNISKDSSFISRHNEVVSSQIRIDLLRLALQEERDKVFFVDLEGFDNIKRKLFGRIIQNGDKMIWQKSDFVKNLENGVTNFEVINLSYEAKNELNYLFDQGKNAGYVQYHGYRIPIPTELDLNFAAQQFDFSQFSDRKYIEVTKGVQYSRSLRNHHIINQYLFDSLLYKKEIDNKSGQYFEFPGLIESCLEIGDEKVLSLFITHNLSDSQYYCLFNEAKKHNVVLDLSLAPGVSLPENIKYQEQTKSEQEDDEYIDKRMANIIVSNDPNQVLRKLNEQENALVIDVEDFSYQDLIERESYERSESAFKDFKKIESDIIGELTMDQKVVIKGEFAPDLLQMLEPIILGKNPQLVENLSNLTVIIESSTAKAVSLDYLNSASYRVDEIDVVESVNEKGKIIKEEYPLGEVNLENSHEESDKFIKARIGKFKELLRGDALLRLIGHSGVGKSQLMKIFEENPELNVKISRELSSFKKWALDIKGNNDKVLFIDEANIEDTHFTLFSTLKEPWKKGEVIRQIFYQGEFFEITPNHKVVFASNPSSYGGGRNEQKVFADGRVPEFHLKDFPASYIYEEILNKVIYETLDQSIKDQIDQDVFKEICRESIINYQNDNQERRKSSEESFDESNDATVRELQEEVLTKLTSFLGEAIYPEVKSKNFLSLPSTKELEKSLIDFVNIRKRQKQGDFTSKAIGLNGMIISGDPGSGKSAMIQAVLESQSIFPANISDEKDMSGNSQKYYKIDASLDLEAKKLIIARAYEEGNAVWMDEVNSCIDDGSEKLINAALTGDHPLGDNGIKIRPGFMMIMSINSAGLEGRSIISPALRHRTIQVEPKSLQEYNESDFQALIQHWIEQDSIDINSLRDSDYAISQSQEDFMRIIQSDEGEEVNLRSLRKKLPEILSIYNAKYSDTQESRTHLKVLELLESELQEIYAKKPTTSLSPSIQEKIENRVSYLGGARAA